MNPSHLYRFHLSPLHDPAMNRRLLYSLAICCVLLLGPGCDSQGQQEAFDQDAFAVPSGFTRTDADGQVLNEDADDWRTSPVYVGRIRIEPAFPNPTNGQFVNIPVRVIEFNAVVGRLQLVSLDESNRFVLLDDASGELGADVFTFNPTFLGRRGLVRVFILDGRGEVISYGDLQVE